MNIPLHPTLGFNPHLTYCPRCGGDGSDLLLLGAKDTKFECDECKTTSFGSRHCIPCKEQGKGSHRGKVIKIEKYERLPGGLCGDCKKEIEEWRALVEAGGLYARCTDCNMEGVVPPSEVTARVREQQGCPAPAPMGIEYSKADCPQCGPSDEEAEPVEGGGHE